MAILGSLIVPYYSNYKQTVAIEEEKKRIVIYLKDARSRAMGGEDFKKWGVYFTNVLGGDDYFELYYTDSDYASGSVSEKIWLDKSVEFTSPGGGSTEDILFQVHTATTSSSVAVTIALKSGASPKTITVNEEGGITFD